MSTAYSQIVEGVVLPRPIGGHPAVDFCNTRAGWGEPEPKEYLAGYGHLVAWARAAQLLDAGAAERLRGEASADPEGADSALLRAKRLREALYPVLLDSHPGPEWDAVAAEAQAARKAAALVQRDGRAAWAFPAEVGLEEPVLAVAEAAAELLASAGVEHVRRCPGPGCGWLFLDAHGRRRWCTMAVCGNRAKARRHAAKTRDTQTSGA